MNSEKKNHQIIFEQQSKFFKSYLEQTPVIFFLHAEDGRFLYANPKATEILGYSLDELLDMHVSSIDAHASPQNLPLLWQKMCEHGAITFEAICRRKDGTTFPVEVTANLLELDGVPYTSSFVQDITERKRVEEAFRITQFSFDKASFGIFRCGSQAQILNANEQACKSLGYTQEELCQLTLADIDPKFSYENWRNRFEKRAEGNVLTFESVHRRKDGTTFPVEISANTLEFQGNKYSISFVRDITTQKNVDQQKAKMERHLQRAQKMELLGTLAGGVAHDLNNILSGIVSYPELLLMQIPEDSSLRKPLMVMHESGRKAAAVVQDLLTLARRGVIVEEVLNLNEIITAYLESPEYKSMLSFHPEIKVSTALDEDLLNISGSAVHLSKTVMNLVTNAAEAMPDGGMLHISTSNNYLDQPVKGYDEIKEGDYVVLTVSDSGVGIPPSDIDKIFEPFFTKKLMGRSGTGLGMTVAWSTVKDHDGYIDVSSIENQGSQFRLYFPVTRTTQIDKDPLEPIESFFGRGESILLVDDITEQLQIASDLLSYLGYSVSTAQSGDEAIDYLRHNRVDLIVLDMIMPPGRDGLDTYREIIKLHPAQKAIIASGFSETDRVKEAIQLGAGPYIKKPYTWINLGKAVQTALSTKSL